MDQRWSVSRLEALSRCGEWYRRAYLEGEPAPTTPAAARGRAVHEVARRSHARQRDAIRGLSGRDRLIANLLAIPSMDEAADIAAMEYETSLTVADASRVEKDLAVGLAVGYVRRWAQEVEPLEVERKIEVRPDGTDVTLVGVIDLVDQDADRIVIADIKTGTRKPKPGASKRSLQLTAYHALYRNAFQVVPDAVRLDHLYLGDGLTMRQVEESTRTERDMVAFAERINAAVRQLEAGNFLPASTLSWFCNPRWCGFYASCRYVGTGGS